MLVQYMLGHRVHIIAEQKNPKEGKESVVVATFTCKNMQVAVGQNLLLHGRKMAKK